MTYSVDGYVISAEGSEGPVTLSRQFMWANSVGNGEAPYVHHKDQVTYIAERAYRERWHIKPKTMQAAEYDNDTGHVTLKGPVQVFPSVTSGTTTTDFGPDLNGHHL
jgi:hypothetical protein